MEGVPVIFEVALAILNMVHDDVLQYTEEVDIVTYIHKRTINLQDPTKLLKNVRLSSISPSPLPPPLGFSMHFFLKSDWLLVASAG
jgi:hypothetical protein